MDNFRIDSHKLIYHVPRVYDWLRGENIYPIYIEICLYGGCNHRCIFCAFDYLGYKPNILDKKLFKKFIISAKEQGIKSIMYAGEGEPLLHKDISSIVHFTKENGIDVAVTSNAVMFSKELAAKMLPYLSWFRASIDAGTPKTYSLIHKSSQRDFNIVLSNLKEAVRIKDRNKYNCNIGVQFLLILQNYSEAAILANKLKDMGVDYLIIKPYSQHPQSKNRIGSNLKYKDLFYLEKELKRYTQGKFQIIFRKHAMDKLSEEKIHYRSCLGLPFATFMASTGDIYPCGIFFGNRSFVFGNIYKDSFKNIWEGNRRKKIMNFIYNKWDTQKCRRACRLDEVNRYLWELKNPPNHVNFI